MRAQARERVVERQAGVAAQAEDHLDAVRLEHLDHGLGAAERDAGVSTGLFTRLSYGRARH